MLDERFVRLRTHRDNIARYQGILKTDLTDLERQFIERRLSEEQSEFELLQTASITAMEQSCRVYPQSLLVMRLASMSTPHELKTVERKLQPAPRYQPQLPPCCAPGYLCHHSYSSCQGEHGQKLCYPCCSIPGDESCHQLRRVMFVLSCRSSFSDKNSQPVAFAQRINNTLQL